MPCSVSAYSRAAAAAPAPRWSRRCAIGPERRSRSRFNSRRGQTFGARARNSSINSRSSRTATTSIRTCTTSSMRRVAGSAACSARRSTTTSRPVMSRCCVKCPKQPSSWTRALGSSRRHEPTRCTKHSLLTPMLPRRSAISSTESTSPGTFLRYAPASRCSISPDSTTPMLGAPTRHAAPSPTRT